MKLQEKQQYEQSSAIALEYKIRAHEFLYMFMFGIAFGAALTYCFRLEYVMAIGVVIAIISSQFRIRLEKRTANQSDEEKENCYE